MYKQEYIRSLVNMHKQYDIRKHYQVTENYTAKIDDICLGIYVNSNGYSITALGIEEEYERLTKKDYKRYWILDHCVDEKNISFKEIYGYVASAYDKHNLCYISTNYIHLLRILKTLKTELIEINPKDVISLIKGCLRDKKLEIKEHLRPEIHEKLSNYNIDDENLFINSLYLALHYDYDSVLLTHQFPPLPVVRKDLDFEEIPLEELADYIRGNPDDKVAHTIYVTRWNEREKLEFEASEKNREE